MRTSIVLKKGTPIPCQSERHLPYRSGQPNRHSRSVTEGEDTDLAYVKIVGEGTMKYRPIRVNLPSRFILEYDHDGIIHVRVFDLTGNAWLGELQIKRTSNLTEQDIEDKMAKLRHREVG